MEKEEKKKKFFSNFIKSLKNSQNDGHNKETGISLVELLVVATILGVMAVIVAPQISFREPTTDAYNQTKALTGQIRQRAIATTSAMRMKVDPSDNDKFIVEVVNSRGCESITKLSANASAGDDEIVVYSASGFQVGDRIDIGGSQNHEILQIPNGTTIEIESTGLASAEATDAPVKLSVDWEKDNSLQESDLTLPKNVTVSSNIPNWSLCFNSRGIATILNDLGESQPRLELTLRNNSNNSEEMITILRGGATDTTN